MGVTRVGAVIELIQLCASGVRMLSQPHGMRAYVAPPGPHACPEADSARSGGLPGVRKVTFGPRHFCVTKFWGQDTGPQDPE